MMKKVILIAALSIPAFGLTQSSPSATGLNHMELAQNRRQVRRPRAQTSVSDFKNALALSRSGKYAEASQILFRMIYNPRYRSQAPRIRYILGLNLWKMKLYQLAAFQFISVVKDGNGKYVNLALGKLSLVANILGDDSLLNYAISRVKVSQFPANQRDMLYFRIGEYQQRSGQYAAAADSFGRVARGSSLYSKAKYQQGLAYDLSGKTGQGLQSFEQMRLANEGKSPTDPAYVGALMGMARTYYQMKNWDQAIEYYRQVPRDSLFWHDTLFESSWAMLRSGRFRSALSNFQSLHSAYYEGYYLPESLLLRGIVYLYICKFDEIEKVLDLFQKQYKPVYKKVDALLNLRSDPSVYFNMMVQLMIQKKRGQIDPNSALPYVVAQKISQEGDYQNSYGYIRMLLQERHIFNSLPAAWKSDSIGSYAKKVLDTRLSKAKSKAGRQIKNHLLAVKKELVELFEQEGFIRFEALNSKKEELKKEIAGKDVATKQVDENRARDFYIQNGYQYWPFDGEYWLDEIGNYHYVGTQSCK
jgi:hypothetical protein